MRLLKIVLYVLVILVLQTVVFARLNFFGVRPDLVLVLAIVWAVLFSRRNATLLTLITALMQDILSFGIYLNIITKVVVGTLVSTMKEGFIGDDFHLAVWCVALFTPLSLIAEGIILFFFAHKQVDVPHLLFMMIFATIYNFILLYPIFFIVKKIGHD
ncbi:hypothetical protein ACFL31_00115 [Candidatus Margulisiibacteriota bacterium]